MKLIFFWQDKCFTKTFEEVFSSQNARILVAVDRDSALSARIISASQQQILFLHRSTEISASPACSSLSSGTEIL